MRKITVNRFFKKNKSKPVLAIIHINNPYRKNNFIIPNTSSTGYDFACNMLHDDVATHHKKTKRNARKKENEKQNANDDLMQTDLVCFVFHLPYLVWCFGKV